MDSEREGEGGKIWENGIETCKISCVKRVASPGSMHDILSFYMQIILVSKSPAVLPFSIRTEN